MQVNDPVVPVFKEPLVQLLFEIVTPLKFNPTRLDTENPVPDTVTVVPTGPWLGLTVILGVVTVNVVDATCPPASVAVTIVPDVPPGTLSVQLNAPEALVVSDPLVQLDIDTLSKTSEARAVDVVKPVPDTVTVAPTGPPFGLTAIAGFVTMKFAVAPNPVASVATTDS